MGKPEYSEYLDLTVVCSHSYESGDWGSVLNEKYAHHPSRFMGGCWICSHCRNAIASHTAFHTEPNIDKVIFTDVSIYVRKALEIGELSSKPEMFFIPDFTSWEITTSYPEDYTKDTEILYDKSCLYSTILQSIDNAGVGTINSNSCNVGYNDLEPDL